MSLITELVETVCAIYNSLKFKAHLEKALKTRAKGSFMVQNRSIFTYENTEVIRYELSSPNASNIFYVFLPYGTTATRLIAYQDEAGTLETRSFYGNSLHVLIASFMLAKFGET